MSSRQPQQPPFVETAEFGGRVPKRDLSGDQRFLSDDQNKDQVLKAHASEEHKTRSSSQVVALRPPKTTEKLPVSPLKPSNLGSQPPAYVNPVVYSAK